MSRNICTFVDRTNPYNHSFGMGNGNKVTFPSSGT